MKQLYYQTYLTGSLLNSASYWAESWQSTAASGTFDDTNLTFPSTYGKNISFLAIPPITFGEQVSRNTFNLSSTDNVSYRLIDDGNGNVIDTFSGSRHVGNIFYAQGIVTLTDNDYVGILLNNNFTISSSVIPSPSPTPTPSITRTPTVTPSVTRTPTATQTATVSTTPSITRTASITPTTTVSISATPSITATPSVTITPSVTRSVTPSITPSTSNIITYSVEVRHAIESSIIAGGALVFYKLGFGGTKTQLGGTITGPVCDTDALTGTISNIPAGTNLYIGVQLTGGTSDIRFGAGGCAGSATTYCGWNSNPYIFTVNSNTTASLKLNVVSQGYVTC
jgi:hypothetical protein